MPVKIFGREPAAWAALVAVLLQVVGAFVADFDPTVQAWVNAVVAAVLGLIVAISVRDGVVAAITGLAQAVITLAVGLGLDWSSERQAIVLSAVGAIAAAFVRTQVTARIAAADLRLAA
jgi:hypothetical protein